MDKRIPENAPGRDQAADARQTDLGVGAEVDASFGEPRHPIQVVARRTGLTPDALRAWEKRYHTVSPERHTGGRRLYSDADIERLSLLRRATMSGRRISDIAALETRELRAMVAEDDGAHRAREAAGLAAQALRSSSEEALLLERCLDAVDALDAADLELVLAEANAALETVAMVERVLSPLLIAVGERWESGRLGIAHEHLATAAVRSALAHLSSVQRVPATAPVVVVATPAGQRHELGALMASATACASGWRPIYLGASLPADEIATTAVRHQARAVALSVIYPDDDPLLRDEVRRLRRALPADTALLIGGRAVAGYSDVIAETGAITLGEYSALARELARLRV